MSFFLVELKAFSVSVFFCPLEKRRPIRKPFLADRDAAGTVKSIAADF
jgi:hypothetical protein